MVTQTPDSAEASAPVASARAVRSTDRKRWVLIVDTCPLCSLAHVHGGGAGAEPVYGERLSHCAARDQRRPYDMIPAAGAQ